MSIEGHGPYQIARMLRQEHVERPSCYLGRRGVGNRNHSWDESRSYDWNGSEIISILQKPEYMGHTVNFRTYKESYKDKGRKEHNPEDWKIFENTQEAIVEPEIWRLAQRARQTVRRTDSTGVANPLTGLVYCADCGARMYNHRCIARQMREGRNPDPETGLSPYDFFECSAYNRSHRREEKLCTPHRITTRAIRSILLESIRMTSAYAISNEEEFIEKVRAASKVKQEQSAKELKRKLARDRRRFTELDGIIKKLYESYATGRITEKRFERREQAALEESVASEQAELDAFNEDTLRADQFLEIARKYTDFTKLTAPMLLEFVDKVLVHGPDFSSGERVVVVDVYLRFIGNFTIPAPELTPEELAEQERLRARQKAARQRQKRHREKKRKAALEAKQAALAEKEPENMDT